MTKDWRQIIDAVLYGLMYTDEITADTVEWNADRAVRHIYFELGPEVYYRAIHEALASGEQLNRRWVTQSTQEQVVAFLRAMAARIGEMRPWPEPVCRRLDESMWSEFGHAVPIAVLDDSAVGVMETLQRTFDRAGDGSNNEVLMLRLRTGETVALLGSYDTDDPVTLLTDAGGDTAEVIEHFVTATGFPAERVTRL
jgi:hypothetical protein